MRPWHQGNGLEFESAEFGRQAEAVPARRHVAGLERGETDQVECQAIGEQFEPALVDPAFPRGIETEFERMGAARQRPDITRAGTLARREKQRDRSNVTIRIQALGACDRTYPRVLSPGSNSPALWHRVLGPAIRQKAYESLASSYGESFTVEMCLTALPTPGAGL